MPTTTSRARFVRAALLAAIVVAPLAACGDDDPNGAEASTTTAAPSDATDAASDGASDDEGVEDAEDLGPFCALATDLSGITPSSAQLAEYATLAPAEIAEPVGVFVDAFEAAGGDLEAVFSDPEAAAASDRIAEFEAERCGITPPGPPPGAVGG